MPVLEIPLAHPDDHGVLRSEVREFLTSERQARPEIFTGSGFDRAFSQRLGARGWLGMVIPEKFGGAGRSPVEQFIVAEELLAARAPIGAHHAAERQTAPMLVRHGTLYQRELFLPAIAAGDIGFALGMSEPDSGSDLASVRSRAIAVEGGWSLTGTKVWTSWADRVEQVVVLCRTSVREGRKHAGLSQLIVDLKAPGVVITPIATVDGRAHFCEVSFKDVLVSDEMVLGEIGNGWSQVNSELSYERSGPDRWLSTFRVYAALVGAAATGETEATVAVGRCASWYLTLHELSYGIALAVSNGEDPSVAAAVVKDLGTRFEQDVLEAARRFSADAATTAEIAQLRDAIADVVLIAPGFTIRGGATEILRTVIARELTR
jgi:alkylation response protein AidB-like acyl-CoA dehydrogenase